MQPFEFLGYEATPAEKYLGIATVRAWGKIILKYKVVAGKDGHGFFSAPSSYKLGSDAQGKDRYEKCFMVDSNYESKQIDDLIRANVNPYGSNSDPFAQNSAQNQQNPFAYQSQQNNRNLPPQNANSQNYSQQFTQPVPQQQNQGPLFGYAQQPAPPNGLVMYKGQWVEPSSVPASERMNVEVPF